MERIQTIYIYRDDKRSIFHRLELRGTYVFYMIYEILERYMWGILVLMNVLSVCYVKVCQGYFENWSLLMFVEDILGMFFVICYSFLFDVIDNFQCNAVYNVMQFFFCCDSFLSVFLTHWIAYHQRKTRI